MGLTAKGTHCWRFSTDIHTRLLRYLRNSVEVWPSTCLTGSRYYILSAQIALGAESPTIRPGPNQARLFYDEQVLFDENPTRQPVSRVKEYSQDIKRRTQSVLADYAKHSQERDRTFPERLVRFVREGHKTLSEREILTQMADLEAKRRRLIRLGLFDSESGLRDLTEDDVRRAPEALTIYVGDIQEKLKVFDDMASRIGSLVDIVNSRFKYKYLSLDRDHGFQVLSNVDDTTISLEDIFASGEQHELVVLYELLFRAPRSGLILVDEPEISLHVGWQSRFLSDLINILELTDAYAIVVPTRQLSLGIGGTLL